jgi:hypothetical protein
MWEARSVAAILHLSGFPTWHRGTECPSHFASGPSILTFGPAIATPRSIASPHHRNTTSRNHRRYAGLPHAPGALIP